MGLFKKIKKAVKKVAKIALPVAGSILGGPLGGILGKAGSALLGSDNASQNAGAAGQYAQQAGYTPTGISMPGLGIGFDAAGNMQGQIGNPMNQLNAQSMIGASNQLWGNYLGAGNPLAQLQGASDQYNQDMSAIMAGNSPLANNITDMLRQQAQPAEQQAAQGLAQRLFSSGRLGQTGGQGMMGNLVQAQQMADLQRQQAGLDYAQNTTNNRFANAMQVFGAGSQQQGQSLQGAFQAMGLGSQMGNMDIQNMMQAMGLSGQLSAARAGANANAYMPQLQANVAKNDTNATNLQGLVGSLGGLLNNTGYTGKTPGINPNALNTSKIDPATLQQLSQLQFTF